MTTRAASLYGRRLSKADFGNDPMASLLGRRIGDDRLSVRPC